MSLTLSDGTTTVTLHPDLMWSDEFNWHPVEQHAERTITGALVVMPALRDGGRPITLEPEDDESAWMARADVQQLRNWAAVPGQELNLTLRGETRAVVFRHEDGGLEARPVVHFSDSDIADQDFYRCVLRLMEL